MCPKVNVGGLEAGLGEAGASEPPGAAEAGQAVPAYSGSEFTGKVLMTADTIGGVWTYALELARGLHSQGARVGLATMGAPLSRAQRAEAASIPGLEVFESTYRLEWMAEPWADVAASGEWLKDLERRFEPDIVHLNNYCHGALRFHCPVLMVGHSCVLSWWRAVHGCDAPPEWNRYRDEVARGLQAANLVVTPTSAMLDAVKLHYGPLGRTTVVPNGQSGSSAPLLATGTPSAAKQPFVFTAGRLWDEAKNLETLERAAGALPWPVFAAGDNRHPDGRVREFRCCRSLGRLSQEQMSWWMERAAIYALPALYEPFGLSILEAALAGCALVLGDLPSLRELWSDAAIFVSPRDSAALARELSRLMERPEKRIALAVAARERARMFSSDRMTEQYSACFRTLAPGRR